MIGSDRCYGRDSTDEDTKIEAKSFIVDKSIGDRRGPASTVRLVRSYSTHQSATQGLELRLSSFEPDTRPPENTSPQ
jgi:hypothetical protein